MRSAWAIVLRRWAMTKQVRLSISVTRLAWIDAFAFGVEVAGGFVEDQDLRVGEDGAGDGDALPLAAAELHAALADERVVAVGQCVDELVGVGDRGGAADVVGRRAAVAVGDVRGDGAVEQEHVLLDDADQAAVAVDVDVAQVAAVEQDAAAGGVVEAGDEVAERGLAAAAGADEGDRLARLDVERDVFERERARSRDS